MKTLGRLFMCLVYYFVVIWKDFSTYITNTYEELKEQAHE